MVRVDLNSMGLFLFENNLLLGGEQNFVTLLHHTISMFILHLTVCSDILHILKTEYIRILPQSNLRISLNAALLSYWHFVDTLRCLVYCITVFCNCDVIFLPYDPPLVLMPRTQCKSDLSLNIHELLYCLESMRR